MDGGCGIDEKAREAAGRQEVHLLSALGGIRPAFQIEEAGEMRSDHDGIDDRGCATGRAFDRVAPTVILRYRSDEQIRTAVEREHRDAGQRHPADTHRGESQRITRGPQLGSQPTEESDILGVLSSQPHIQELVASERVRPLRRLEYERMVDEGFFEDERIELLDGVIIEMTPQGTSHAGTVQRLTDRLAALLGARASLRVQLPFAASETSEPEPDLAVVAPGDYDLAHPAQALLLIEVAESSLNKDRHVKAGIYAAACVPEYWLVDLAKGVIEVRTQPTGDGYAQLHSVRQGDRIRLCALPEVEIAVSDIIR